MTMEFRVPSATGATTLQSVVASKLAQLNAKYQEVDVTKLVQYERKIKDIGTFNKLMAPHYLRDFIDAIDVTSVMLSTAIFLEQKSKAILDEAKSIAYLDNAGDYLNSKNIKDTAEARKQYVDRDPDVIEAKDLYSKATAMVQLLNNKLWAFRYAHDDVKKISYADQKITNFEGM